MLEEVVEVKCFKWENVELWWVNFILKVVLVFFVVEFDWFFY